MILPRVKPADSSSGQLTRRICGAFKTASLVLTLFWVTACSSSEKNSDVDQPLVADKYTLSEDRKAFDELRQSIPIDLRKENDEKAFMDNMMSDLSKTPSDVRSRFSSITSKKREVFNKDIMKAREVFNRELTGKRNEFTKAQVQERTQFSQSKRTSEERKEFFDELELKRKDYYTAEKEKREEFEAQIRDRRKNFDDYMRSKNDEFNQLHRDYTKRYEENRKAQADLKKAAEDKRRSFQQEVDKDYDAVRRQTPTPLGTQTGE